MLALSPFVILPQKRPMVSRYWILFLFFHNNLLILSVFCRFALILVIQTQKKQVFLKIIPEKFCQFGKKQYLCTRFRKNGARHHMEEGKKKEFFDKIYINRK